MNSIKRINDEDYRLYHIHDNVMMRWRDRCCFCNQCFAVGSDSFAHMHDNTIVVDVEKGNRGLKINITLNQNGY